MGVGGVHFVWMVDDLCLDHLLGWGFKVEGFRVLGKEFKV
jgi:hypothetical protein